MAISADYITLQRQVADELGNRTDLLSPLSGSGLTLSPIKNAIQSAIAKWERSPFFFSEANSQPLFTTITGQELYGTAEAAAISTSPDIYVLHALISGTRQNLTKRSWQWMEETSSNPSARGQPTDWAYLARQIRLYPIPDGAYPIRAARITQYTALSADSDTNEWTTTAYDLIRSEAKLILAREVLMDDELAQRMEMVIHNPQGYLASLRRETVRRARSRIRPTEF